jgi:DNA polymerase III subunit alpha
MFDLFGQSTPLPMPHLELNGEDVGVKEKLAWEKEMIGVYLSEHPFARYARIIDPTSVTLIGQINEELSGEEVSLVGMVSSVRELSTKDHRAFCSAVLEDLESSIEVMVWPKTYENTRELWQEGNFLRVQGKVKMKDEKLQVGCDSVEMYVPDAAPKKAVNNLSTSPSGPEKTSSNGAIGNGHNGNGNGNGHNGNGKSPVNNVLHKVTFVIHETSDEDKDESTLNELVGLLKEYRGRDEVFLRIVNAEQVTTMKMPSVYIDYSPDLVKRLGKYLKPEDLIVEKLVPG